MKRWLSMGLLLAAGVVAGCAGSAGAFYQSISPEKAKAMMGKPGVVVIDVREPAEYKEGHVPGAVLLPLGTISEKTAAEAIPSKEFVVLVYCRSGVRAKKGAAKLAELGYTKVYEFGGILQWPYEVERD